MAIKTVETKDGLQKQQTLGSLRLRNHETNEIILIPTPSDDPNDPLNWSRAYRYYLAILLSLAIFFSNFLAAGPSVSMVEITTDFFGPPGPKFESYIAKASYFFTTTSLLQGMSNLIWMPLIVKFGRRPIYVTSFVLYTACAAWAGGATSYGSHLTARILMGAGAGASETLAPLTISDIFFLHERGTIMAIYTCFLGAGVGGGILVCGLISISLDWRYCYWVAVALIGAATLLIILTFPETEYERGPVTASESDSAKEVELGKGEAEGAGFSVASRIETATSATTRPPPAKRSFVRDLRIFSGVHTKESLWKMFWRPCVMLFLPPVFWATLVMAVTIGFLVAISSNFASAFATAYHFEPYQAGLCFISSIIGSLIGIFFGGHFSDWVADYLTKRNGGVREPEMRLPAVMISVVTAPLALVLYGEGIGLELHWMCATIGLGLLNFSIVQATNVSLVYTIDAYRPVAGEVTVTQFAFKSAFGFLLSFYTNPWISQSGYERAFGAMAGIAGAVMLGWIPFYIWGKRIRHATWQWGFVRRMAHWHEDREVGE
ncbi:major facilitator superfamily domain-containing protein [Macrophomina phaseolina]|uniref:Major facilitator superfamily domain-containing protein n=1 Tax=Macrophomina phaseolina TaxID=35725 RepID=A0ABQ8G077_9PEZI|nr:major facilitator superfamily domain-containing protein [Macrophomina phaseolina]